MGKSQSYSYPLIGAICGSLGGGISGVLGGQGGSSGGHLGVRGAKKVRVGESG